MTEQHNYFRERGPTPSVYVCKAERLAPRSMAVQNRPWHTREGVDSKPGITLRANRARYRDGTAVIDRRPVRPKRHRSGGYSSTLTRTDMDRPPERPMRL